MSIRRARRLGLIVVAALIGGVVASPAWACLNDRDTDASEREFRSSYREGGMAANRHEQGGSPGLRANGLATMAGGLAVSTAGFAYVVASRSRRQF